MPNKTVTFGVDLLPLTDANYNLGNANKKWNIFGDVTGTATNASKAGAANLTTTTNALAYYSDTAGSFANLQRVTALDHVSLTTPAGTTTYQDGLRIVGNGYGNAADLLANADGATAYGDGGPQIQFSTGASNQDGAIIFTHYNNTSGMQESFQFVGQSPVAVRADGLIAKTRATIGDNQVNTSYTLYVNGHSLTSGNIYIKKTEPIVSIIDTNSTRTDDSFRLNLTIANSGRQGLWSSAFSTASGNTSINTTAAWLIYRDTDGKVYLPGNADSASKVAAKIDYSKKSYVLGTQDTIDTTPSNVSLTGGTGVYLTTTPGELSAYRYSWHYGAAERAYSLWNDTDQSIDFIFL